jgi:spermidine synthase
MSRRTALIIAAVSGFLALSWEILWARLFNFASESRAPAFGAMLGSYLLGLALGSLASMKWQHRDAQTSIRSLALLILVANVIAYAVAPIVALLVSWLPAKMWLWNGAEIASWLWTMPCVALAAAVQGTVLPLLCHVAIPADEKAGRSLSHIYLANIIGSGAGSLLTGFVFMDWMPLMSLQALFLLVALLLGLGLLRSAKIRRPAWILAALIAAMALPYAMGGKGSLWPRLQYKNEFTAGMRFPLVVESRHGVITVDSNRKVYGNGAYDGYINTGLTPGDWHVRPYFLSAVHAAPRRVLVIGMSAGAWTQIIAHHPQVESVDVVEISEAYLDVISHYPQVSGVLTNEKVHIHIDDGRRWLKRHPQDRFDAILMNTTHHWREFASGLLSQEFLELAKGHLAPGGLVMWNCTQSKRAMKTALDVFPHTMMCLNNCVASNEPLTPNRERWQQVLSTYQIEGRPVFDLSGDQGKADLGGVLALIENEGDEDSHHQWWIMSRERMEKVCEGQRPITDDNLGHEY